ncbi:EscU/YscU/HrcU family type III secretion system export apparatus switch protein [Microbacterium capsulatum]|uniref:EscU/YscU/HrcU family type III secretion system export apparatus switch protein n=1 Tax=Microbacterium capsulatum TaxID=3041921 RepID=A0ABU0XES5_9MICO|nr:EscU/YscU/HrcU family type III secretion system export apparatus switch protein [Microbacterium sp. ASV81]MDQ4213214.1 EscU/YscU/HrcU family type III secretion system export apparatus switch protein [Microbacterium sp. ASV81]
MSDSGERTEKATERRLREARRKGRIGRSQDFTAWVAIAAAALMMPVLLATAVPDLTEQMLRVARVAQHPTISAAWDALGSALASLGGMLLPLLLVVLAATVATAVAQGGVHLRGLTMRTQQFDIVSGLLRVFGRQALWEGAKALLKTAAIGAALWIVVSGLVPVLMASGSHTIGWLLGRAADGVVSLLQVAVAVGVLLAGIDIAVVLRRNRQHTHMTRKEAKDEHRTSEGDPLVRSQRRSRQLALSRNRMIAAVGDSDVVLVNPTHVAVALRYEPGRSAPRVVAKGAGVVARKIREKAEENGVPMVRDVPLARALHAACDLGQEIPEELYTAVAQVLAFIDRLKRRGSPRGLHTMPAASTRDRGR